MNDKEWKETLTAMDANRAFIESWSEAEPDPVAARCEFSRHRTLAHLRAAQEFYLEAVLAFAERDNPSVTVLHAWRRFTLNRYEVLPWRTHLEAYQRDRTKWEQLVRDPSLDRSRGGRFNRNERTIASLTQGLVTHEQAHFEALMAREAKPKHR